jgi:predicted AAA+ superfamily ATPase
LTENAIGVKLLAITQETGGELFYWRDRDDEVDFVIQVGDKLIAIEVKSGNSPVILTSLDLFGRRYKKTKKTVILQTINKIKDKGNFQYITIADFFSNPRKSIMI